MITEGNEMIGELNPPHRVLLGPGPSMVHPRVLRAMSVPLIGHLDPEFLKIMDDIQTQLRRLFQTRNTFTIAVSGTGSAAMEAAIVNLVEPGDRVMIGINGVFGTRLAQMVERSGGTVIPMEVPWGEIIPFETIHRHLQTHQPVKAVALVHAETSTGAHQPLHDLGELCHRYGSLLIVDAVTSLGGMPVLVDEWGIDVCYSATQKCLSCPPGLAPLTFSDKALQAVRTRKTKCYSWYLDCTLVSDYWNDQKRTYHHTAPISMAYALRESLRIIHEEGLESRYLRHQQTSAALRAGLGTLGFSLLPDRHHALPTLTCVQLPPSIDDRKMRSRLLNDFHIEIGGGLGPLAGKVWRIGLMGESAKMEHVMLFLSALEQVICEMISSKSMGEAVKTAVDVYTQTTQNPRTPSTNP